MPEILIVVRDKIPVLIGETKFIVAENSDYTIKFMFDEEWTDKEKDIYFVRMNGFVYPVQKTKNNTISVPIQRDIKLLSRLQVGVQQGDLITTQPCEIPVHPAITDVIEDDAVQPQQSMWEDMIDRIEKLEKNGGGGGSGGGGGVNFTPGNALELTPDGVLNVRTAPEPEPDNTLPITSAGVAATVGNIEILLKTI